MGLEFEWDASKARLNDVKQGDQRQAGDGARATGL